MARAGPPNFLSFAAIAAAVLLAGANVHVHAALGVQEALLQLGYRSFVDALEANGVGLLEMLNTTFEGVFFVPTELAFSQYGGGRVEWGSPSNTDRLRYLLLPNVTVEELFNLTQPTNFPSMSSERGNVTIMPSNGGFRCALGTQPGAAMEFNLVLPKVGANGKATPIAVNTFLSMPSPTGTLYERLATINDSSNSSAATFRMIVEYDPELQALFRNYDTALVLYLPTADALNAYLDSKATSWLSIPGTRFANQLVKNHIIMGRDLPNLYQEGQYTTLAGQTLNLRYDQMLQPGSADVVVNVLSPDLGEEFTKSSIYVIEDVLRQPLEWDATTAANVTVVPSPPPPSPPPPAPGPGTYYNYVIIPYLP